MVPLCGGEVLTMCFVWPLRVLGSVNLPPRLFCECGMFLYFFSSCIALQEYVDYYGTSGVQHIAINTSDIIAAVSV